MTLFVTYSMIYTRSGWFTFWWIHTLVCTFVCLFVFVDSLVMSFATRCYSYFEWSVSYSVPHRFFFIFLHLCCCCCYCILKLFTFCHRHHNQPCLWTIFISLFCSVCIWFFLLHALNFFSLLISFCMISIFYALASEKNASFNPRQYGICVFMCDIMLC